MGTSHLKLIWVRGFKHIISKPHSLKHHIPEHPKDHWGSSWRVPILSYPILCIYLSIYSVAPPKPGKGFERGFAEGRAWATAGSPDLEGRGPRRARRCLENGRIKAHTDFIILYYHLLYYIIFYSIVCIIIIIVIVIIIVISYYYSPGADGPVLVRTRARLPRPRSPNHLSSPAPSATEHAPLYSRGPLLGFLLRKGRRKIRLSEAQRSTLTNPKARRSSNGCFVRALTCQQLLGALRSFLHSHLDGLLSPRFPVSM